MLREHRQRAVNIALQAPFQVAHVAVAHFGAFSNGFRQGLRSPMLVRIG
jgi:hypothetical protein